jgi:choline dehydrogenase-like flavoprotein
MPHITLRELKPSYDVIVVGSGAAGGQTAYTLTKGRERANAGGGSGEARGRRGPDGGRSPDSVTNAWGQVWDAPNVVVADGASFCSSADKNPTLTIMALAWRAADHLLDELRKGNL